MSSTKSSHKVDFKKVKRNPTTRGSLSSFTCQLLQGFLHHLTNCTSQTPRIRSRRRIVSPNKEFRNTLKRNKRKKRINPSYIETPKTFTVIVRFTKMLSSRGKEGLLHTSRPIQLSGINVKRQKLCYISKYQRTSTLTEPHLSKPSS